LVDTTSPYRSDQYLYVAGGDDDTQIVDVGKSLPLAGLVVCASSGGRVASLRKTPYGEILSYETSVSAAGTADLLEAHLRN
jgi:hypothetical protein